MRIAVIGATGTIDQVVCRTLAVRHDDMPADEVALAYAESVEGTKTGQVLATRRFRNS
jgi:aspartate-semialdehyde dehydrogenase